MDDSDDEGFELPAHMNHPGFVHALEGMLDQMSRDDDPREKEKGLTPSAQRALEEEAAKRTWKSYYDKDEQERKLEAEQRKEKEAQERKKRDARRKKRKEAIFDLTKEELVEAAKEFKSDGNSAIKRLANEQAISDYKDAIAHLKQYMRQFTNIDGSEETELTHEAEEVMLSCHLNVAEAYLRVGKWESALRATEWILQQRRYQHNVKALYRQARAKRMIAGPSLDSAKEDLKLAIKLAPKDKKLRDEWDALKDDILSGSTARKNFIAGGLNMEKELRDRRLKEEKAKHDMMKKLEEMARQSVGLKKKEEEEKAQAERVVGKCDVCSQESESLCARCTSRWYCSRKCQGKDWLGGHREKCPKLAQRRDELLAYMDKRERREEQEKKEAEMKERLKETMPDVIEGERVTVMDDEE